MTRRAILAQYNFHMEMVTDGIHEESHAIWFVYRRLMGQNLLIASGTSSDLSTAAIAAGVQVRVDQRTLEDEHEPSVVRSLARDEGSHDAVKATRRARENYSDRPKPESENDQ